MSELNCSCGATCSQVEALEAEVEKLRGVLRFVSGSTSTSSFMSDIIQVALEASDGN